MMVSPRLRLPPPACPAGSPACAGMVSGQSVFRGKGTITGGADVYLRVQTDEKFLDRSDCPQVAAGESGADALPAAGAEVTQTLPDVHLGLGRRMMM